MGEIRTKADVYEDVQATFGLVPAWLQAMPDEGVPGFWTLFRDLNLSETRIPNKYKELIGLGVAGATRCRYCQLFHSESARLHGASEEELAEAGLVAGVSMAASTFMNAAGVDFEQFRKETQKVIQYARQQQRQRTSGDRDVSARH